MLISVDLPQPLGPNTETILPLGMSRLKSSYSGQPAKYLVRPRMVMCVPRGPGSNGAAAGAGAMMGLMTVDIYRPLQWTTRFSSTRKIMFST
ncbi:Uncharacterised protein [Achromobacter denitrificans]|nr:Uncharacterised protein [Achromobacter denitrificans]